MQSRPPAGTPDRNHYGGDGSLDRAQTLLPQMSGSFFSLSPRVWGLIRGHTALMSLHRSSTPGSRTRPSPPAGTTCSILARLKISEKQVERVTERIGQERLEQRDAQVQAFLEVTRDGEVRRGGGSSPGLGGGADGWGTASDPR